MPAKKVAAARKPKTKAFSPPSEQEPKIVEKVLIVDKADIERRAQRNRKNTLLDPTPADVFAAAQKLVEQEKQKYEDSSYNMRETLKRVYKNYLGIFDQPYDLNTNRKKIFTPLTHNTVDAVSKPISFDSSAIRVLPKTAESRGRAKVINMITPYLWLELNLREKMKEVAQYLTLFGTEVTVQDWLYEEIEVANNADPTTQILTARGFVRMEKANDKTRIVKNDKPRVRRVNLLDMFVPFTAESLAWACKNASAIMRSTQTVDQVQSNPMYDDEAKSLLIGTTWSSSNERNGDSLDQYNSAAYLGFSPSAKTAGRQDFFRQERPFVEIFERHGMVPKSWITLKATDGMEFVPAIITCAGDSTGGTMRTLSVRLSPFGAEGPFEEAWFNKLPNRWYGEGLGERLIALQIWHNEIVNTRRNNELLVQNRMYKYKKGSINPNDLRARPGGGIAVNNMGDVEAIEMGDIPPSSFQEDSYLEGAAQRLAGAAMTPIQKKVTATEAENIQQNSNLTYNELRESLEDYLGRVWNRHIIPLLRKYFVGNQTLPIKVTDSELIMLDTLNGYEPFISDMLGRERFILVEDGSIFDGEFEVVADIEAVTMNRTTKFQALSNMIGMASKIQNSGMNLTVAFRKLAELSGIVDERLFEDVKPPVASGVPMPTQPSVMGPPQGGMPQTTQSMPSM